MLSCNPKKVLHTNILSDACMPRKIAEMNLEAAARLYEACGACGFGTAWLYFLLSSGVLVSRRAYVRESCLSALRRKSLVRCFPHFCQKPCVVGASCFLGVFQLRSIQQAEASNQMVGQDSLAP